jgi:hypothetical protein
MEKGMTYQEARRVAAGTLVLVDAIGGNGKP